MVAVGGLGDVRMMNAMARSVATVLLDGAGVEAEGFGDRFVGDEHLLISALGHGGFGGELFGAAGVSAEGVRRFVRSLERDRTPGMSSAPGASLAVLGIDADDVRDGPVGSFGGRAVADAVSRVDRRFGHRRGSGPARAIVCGPPVLCKLALQHGIDLAARLGAGTIQASHALYGLLAVSELPVGADWSRRSRTDLAALGIEASERRVTSRFFEAADVDVIGLQATLRRRLTAGATGE